MYINKHVKQSFFQVDTGQNKCLFTSLTTSTREKKGIADIAKVRSNVSDIKFNQ